jgi:hypothetical protein
MAAPLRLRFPAELAVAEGPPQDAAKTYLGELVKLIPAEAVALYIFGRSLIAAHFRSEPLGAAVLPEWAYWSFWLLACLVTVIMLRRWLTADPEEGLGPETPAVTIASVSFLIWVYSMGDVFDRVLGIWDPLLAGLLVPLWTVLAPAVFRAWHGMLSRRLAGNLMRTKR